MRALFLRAALACAILCAGTAAGGQSDARVQAALERIAVLEDRLLDSVAELSEIRTALQAMLPPPAPSESPNPPRTRPSAPSESPVDAPSRPRPPPVEPPAPARPGALWSALGGAEVVMEQNDGLTLGIASNVTPGVVRTLRARGLPDYPMRPRSMAARVAGDTAGWSRRAAVRAWGVESQIPAAHHGWVAAAQQGASAGLVQGYLVAWPDDPSGRIGGGQGIPPFGFDWQRNARGLELALQEWVGAVNREPVAADWGNFDEEPLSNTRDDRFTAYTFTLPAQIPNHEKAHWAKVKPLAAHPSHPLHDYRAHDWSHLHRATRAALFLAEHTDLELPRVWLQRYWRDTESILGWHITAPDGNSHKWPLWYRIQRTSEFGYGGWMGRAYAHMTRFAIDMERLGMGGDPQRAGSPSHTVLKVREAIVDAWEHHPWGDLPDARRLLLQWGNSGAVFDSMPASQKALGTYTACIDGLGIWIRELRRLGFGAQADELAAWYGPHPQWILVALGEESIPGYDPALAEFRRYGNQGWHYTSVPSPHSIPFLWQTTHPEIVWGPEWLERARSHYGRNDHPGEYLDAARRKELFGW